MYLFDRGGAEKVITFLSTFFKRKTVFEVLIGHFSLFEAAKGAESEKPSNTSI
jgi:hypothetical protein